MNYKLRALLSFVAIALAACGIAPRTETPIPTIASNDERQSKTLLVMLPGRGDRAGSFVDAGFLELDDSDKFDRVAVDAHFGYYMKRNLIPRLHEDVIQPAKNAGYESIWLLGVSMGGMGSILYANAHPDVIDGVVLLAPYLGDPELAAEIQASGGLANWNADQSDFPAHEVDTWRWLQKTRSDAEPVPILMGYGLDDKFAGFYAPLQDEIDGLRIYTEDGAHNWTTWRKLWETLRADLNGKL